jgi:hypothetical protein
MASWNWANFDPKITKTDKRDRDGAVSKAEKFVEKNLNELALCSFVAVPMVDNNRVIKKIRHIFPPNSPLQAFWNSTKNKEFIKEFDKALEDTQLWALELWDTKEGGDDSKFKDMVGPEIQKKETDVVPKPVKPIFALNTTDMSSYYAEFLKYLYRREGIERFKLWATKDKACNVTKEPTPLKIYDQKAEEILERTKFIGAGSGGLNIGNRLKVVTSYLLNEIGIDHNEHCENVPQNYKRVEINYDDFEKLLTEKKAKETNPVSRLLKAKLLAGKSVGQSQKRVRYAEEVEVHDDAQKRPRIEDEVANESSEDDHDEVPIPLRATPGSLARSHGAATPGNILNLIRSRVVESPGTPVINPRYDASETESDEDEDHLISQHIDEVTEGNVKKAHAGGITTVHLFDVEIWIFLSINF